MPCAKFGSTEQYLAPAPAKVLTNENHYCICLWILPNKYHLLGLCYFPLLYQLRLNLFPYMFRENIKYHYSNKIFQFESRKTVMMGMTSEKVKQSVYCRSKIYCYLKCFAVLTSQLFLHHQTWFLFTTEAHFHSFWLQDQTPKWYLESLRKYLLKRKKTVWWFI